MSKTLLRLKIGRCSVIFSGFVVSILAFQNCGQAFHAKGVSNLSSTAAGAQFVDNCLESNADACIYNKSFTAQTQQVKAGRTPEEVESEQDLAVAFRHLTRGNQLMNDSFLVFQADVAEPLRAKADGSWRYRLTEADGAAKVGQLMSFYWANFAMANALTTTGKFFARDSEIKIITDDSIFGWAPAKNQIHLHKNSSGQSMAMDASTLVYFLGWANLEYATKGEISVFSTNKHEVCGSFNRMDCCVGKTGCSRALASGQAEYFVAMTFPDKPALGDGWADSVQGQPTCQTAYSRQPSSFSTMTAQESYDLCGATKGSIYAMGALYSSIWWNVRNATGSDAHEVDRLFMHHLELLTGDDDFVTVQAKIATLDQTLAGGKYGVKFKEEFQKRGL